MRKHKKKVHTSEQECKAVARKHIKEDAIDYCLFCKEEEKIKESLRNVGSFSG